MGLINGIFSDLLTSLRLGTRRLAVDSQQTSFEENRQFKFYDDCTGADAIPVANILVYQFTSTYPIKIQLRLINGISGARKYTVYPAFGETIEGGSFVDVTADKVSPINNDLSKSGREAHPVSGVAVSKRLATSFTTTAPKRTGTAYKADTNSNRATSSYTASGNASGVAAGNSFFLVFEDLNGADPSEFLFQLEWEEDL